jgi:hypothetical protein
MGEDRDRDRPRRVLVIGRDAEAVILPCPECGDSGLCFDHQGRLWLCGTPGCPVEEFDAEGVRARSAPEDRRS